MASQTPRRNHALPREHDREYLEQVFVQEWPKVRLFVEKLARKYAWVPGMTAEDWKQEFQWEAYLAVKYHDPDYEKHHGHKGRSLPSLMRTRIERHLATRLEGFNAQRRSIAQERSNVVPVTTDVEYDEDGSSGEVWIPDLSRIGAVGNCNKYRMILDLPVDRLTKSVLLLSASGFNAWEIVHRIRWSDIDPNFTYDKLSKMMSKLRKNAEFRAHLEELKG